MRSVTNPVTVPRFHLHGYAMEIHIGEDVIITAFKLGYRRNLVCGENNMHILIFTSILEALIENAFMMEIKVPDENCKAIFVFKNNKGTYKYYEDMPVRAAVTKIACFARMMDLPLLLGHGSGDHAEIKKKLDIRIGNDCRVPDCLVTFSYTNRLLLNTQIVFSNYANTLPYIIQLSDYYTWLYMQ